MGANMTDYYPSIRVIVAVFYFTFWFFKDHAPFSFWWLVVIYGIDYVIAMFILSLTKNILEKR
jgi:hypothetical protein